MPNSKILPPLDQHVWGCPSTSGRPQIKKLPGTKIYWNLILGRVYFIPKIQNFERPRDFGGPQVDHRSKSCFT
jgi:hypothetical protein